MITGDTIKAIRRSRNVSQIALAALSGISQPYLSQIEQGSRIPTHEQEKAILAALSIDEAKTEELATIVRNIHEAKSLEMLGRQKLHTALKEAAANENI